MEPADGRGTKDQGPKTSRNDPDQTPEAAPCAAEVTFIAPSQRGFALLITVTLIAFIVVLLVGLAVYTRVETAVAGNMQRQAQARENALFALNVALGQLQKHAGPDRRVTATSANFGAVDGTRHYTGVWKTDLTADEDPAKPLTWLVSGNDSWVADTSEGAAEGSTVAAPLAVTPDAVGTRVQTLVGTNSAGSTRANWVNAPLVDVTASGVPGASPTAATTIGRYAWWVGDQGVKAPVAVTDTTSAIVFAPYDSAELRGRIRQQFAIGAGAADGEGTPVFEPRDGNNSSLVSRIAQPNQLAFLRLPNSTTQVGLSRVQQNFHAWSPNNFAVLANVKDGGLKQDLSLLPSLLGASFEAWANYPAYMEKFTPDAPTGDTTTGESTTTTTTSPTISPAYGTDPVRRRYVMTPHTTENTSRGSHQVGPVLTYFLLSFNVRAAGESNEQPLEVRARWAVSLWNPYTSALKPEPLKITISRLPQQVQVVNDTPERAGPVGAPFSLREAYGSAMTIQLPWDATDSSGVAAEDRQSWLPGRVYTWRSKDNTAKSASLSEAGFESEFYVDTLDDSAEGVVRSLDAGSIKATDECHLEVTGSETLSITVYAVRPEGDVRLGAFTSPAFVDVFRTNPQAAHSGSYQFSYVFRLAESIDTPAAPSTWLTTGGRDLRFRTLRSDMFVVAENGNDPAQYGASYSKILSPERLLSRSASSRDPNEDVPIYELPRAPILSVGALQHFRLLGQRPFMVGNPWGVTERLNGVPLGQLFDRFYFSGLAKDVTPTTTSTGDLILPNPLLRPLRKADGTKPTLEDMRPTPPTEETPTDGSTTTDGSTPGAGTGSTGSSGGTDDETTGEGETPEIPATDYVVATRSSKHLLQGGAFNLNSTDALAWAAVLRGVRFPAPQEFSYLNVSSSTGTTGDTDLLTVQGGEARFFRFSQSAQETYAAGSDAPEARTYLFRRGMRSLSSAQVKALARKIAELMGVKHAAADAAGGPFRSVEEFLSPNVLFAGVDSEGNAGVPRSLLEAAINDAGINVDDAGAPLEFSSQYLTQADVMTAIAPMLFARSDTFIIRAYGEAVNPARLPANYQTGGTVPSDAIEGRAWCEAIVQRLPEFMDASMSPESRPADFEPTPNPDNPAEVVNPTAAQKLNKELGRRFKVISFRWLTRADI